jgi:Scaffold protein Nfu/NifU N terminal
MGQPITVTTRPGASPSVRLFDLNRSLTGMAIERYRSPDGAHGSRPPDVLARRLFDLGATAVTIYSSVVTVEAPAEHWPQLEPKVIETIEHLFGYYGDDAGWSPDALRALGIEVKPPPEPAK